MGDEAEDMDTLMNMRWCTTVKPGFLLNQAAMGTGARRVMEGYETRSRGRWHILDSTSCNRVFV